MQSGSSLVFSFRNNVEKPGLGSSFTHCPNLLCSLEEAAPHPRQWSWEALSDKVLHASRARKGRGTEARLSWNLRQAELTFLSQGNEPNARADACGLDGGKAPRPCFL